MGTSNYSDEFKRNAVHQIIARVEAQVTDPRQKLNDKREDLLVSKAHLQQNPALVRDHISHTKADFNRADVLRALPNGSTNPPSCRTQPPGLCSPRA